MASKEETTDEVAAAVKSALQNEALAAGVLQFGDVRILISKTRRLQNESAEVTMPADYPNVSTQVRDDYDTWLS